MGMKYFNFDRTTAGSYVYSDKANPAEFEVVKKSDLDAISATTIKPSSSDHAYDLSGRPVDITSAPKGVYIVDGMKTTISTR